VRGREVVRVLQRRRRKSEARRIIARVGGG
jgi:hypothetical protein